MISQFNHHVTQYEGFERHNFCIVTKKGKGYAVAEQEPCIYHGVTAFNKFIGEMEKARCNTDLYASFWQLAL
ncbi:MAG: hypothetical protein R3E08_02570 [Thiotrichaceae bacterium]